MSILSIPEGRAERQKPWMSAPSARGFVFSAAPVFARASGFVFSGSCPFRPGPVTCGFVNNRWQ
jgi:hypothetical protein